MARWLRARPAKPLKTSCDSLRSLLNLEITFPTALLSNSLMHSRTFFLLVYENAKLNMSFIVDNPYFFRYPEHKFFVYKLNTN